MSEVPENILRDLLAGRLDLIGNDLTLLKIEQYLPSDLGTRGFIDILAKDSRGRWVLIELKRTDAAARQAIHEIYKYVEGVKGHLGARDDEIRTVIISTEWRELLVPFSRFVADTSISVEGIRLLVDDAAVKLVGSEKIQPLAINSGRLLSPWHEINFYTNEQRLNDGLKSYDASCKAKGVTDYILVEMQAPEGLYEASVEAVARQIYAIQGGAGEPSADYLAEIAQKMERYDYLLYFVPQQLSADQYLEIIEKDADIHAEVNEWKDEMEGDELLGSLQSSAFSAKPKVDRDRYDIGYPSKFRIQLLENEGWQIRQIHRRGAFARNSVLSNETLLGEIGGDAGVTGQRLKRVIALSNKGELSQLERDIDECLSSNPVWQSAIRSQLAEARSDFPEGEIEVSVFAPTTGLMTLFYAIQENGILHIPSYSLTVLEDGEPRRIYIGELGSTDKNPKGAKEFLKVIAEYYEGDIFAVLMTTTWGAYEARDIDILDDLGLVYSSFRCDMGGDDRSFFRMRNGRWRSVDPIRPFAAFEEYVERNQRLFRLIEAKLAPRISRGIWDGTSAEVQLKPLIDEAMISLGKYYDSPPAECDVCTIPLSDERYISDASLRGHGGWATMCADCTFYHGAGIGWGTGQLYRKESDGRWLMIAGGDKPGEEWDEQ
jgi:hypothetical protein